MKILPALLAVALVTVACERESPTNGITTPAKVAAPAAPVDVEAPNPNAAHYGPHGVAATPTAPAGAKTVVAPATDPETPDMAGHACHCGASCKCGHCAGAIPGCHCKTERTDTK